MGMYLIENSLGHSAEQTPSNSPLLYNDTFTHILPPGARIGNYTTCFIYGDEISAEFKHTVFYITLIYRFV